MKDGKPESLAEALPLLEHMTGKLVRGFHGLLDSPLFVVKTHSFNQFPVKVLSPPV